VLHYLLGAGHLARLLPALLTALGSTLALPLPACPPPGHQELLWLASLPAALLAIQACRRSNAAQLRLFMWVVLLCCVAPLSVTLAGLAPAAASFLLTGALAEGELLVLEQPFSVLWSAFLLLCLVLHGLQIIVIRGLLRAWAPRHGKRH
jgi:hypothetical protein